MSCRNFASYVSRRDFLAKSAYGMGAAALHCLSGTAEGAASGVFPNFAPRAKRVIFLFQSGGPSHLDLFDDKPALKGRFDEDIPESIFGGQRVTGMVAHQDRFPVVPTMYGFQRHGESGIALSDLLPHTAKIVDDICVIHSAHTEAINHDPAITFLQTGSQLPGRPSMGAWLEYGLGSANENLPAFVVLNSVPSEGTAGQGLLARLWGAGFLPSRHQGVRFRSSGDPVLYLSDPAGITRDRRRKMLDGIAAFNTKLYERVGDPEIETRIEQYEMAFRMQASVPELMDITHEPDSVYMGEPSRCGWPAAESEVDTCTANRTTTTSTGRRPGLPARSRPTAYWRAAWPSATSASSSSITAAGTTTASCQRSCPSWPATPINLQPPWCGT